MPAGPWLKTDLTERRLIRSDDGSIYLIAVRDAVVAFRAEVDGASVDLTLDSPGRTLIEEGGERSWDLGGHPGGDYSALGSVGISGEYWFSWRLLPPEVPVQAACERG